MTIDDSTREILAASSIDDNAKTLTLNGQLDRKQYVKIAEILEQHQGKWNKKAKAFVFTVTPSQTLKAILSGEQSTVTTTTETRKQFQAFYTPSALADYIIEQVAYWVPESILEPSAGNGSLVKAIQRQWPNALVDVYEIQDDLHQELNQIPNVTVVGSDFLAATSQKKYDLIAMNPPFNKHQDITHIQHAYTMLADNGVLISIMGLHSFNCSHRADVAFRQWLEQVEGETYDIEAGAFKVSGTTIATRYIILRK